MENKICGFTGHRPSGLVWRYNERDKRCINFKKKLKNLITSNINKGYNYFISGMALGVDMIAAEIVLELKNKYSQIKLECAIPCINQCEKWSNADIKRYNDVLEVADLVSYIYNGNYYNGCMKKRNEYIVDKSFKIIAIFNGKNGGTKQTIELAKAKNMEIDIINPNEE